MSLISLRNIRHSTRGYASRSNPQWKEKSKVVSETNYRRNREDARETHEIACQ